MCVVLYEQCGTLKRVVWYFEEGGMANEDMIVVLSDVYLDRNDVCVY